MVAQVGEMEFRKRMIEGDTRAMQGLHMGTQTTVAEVLKVLGKLPPTTVLSLCNKPFGKYVKEHLLQHGDALDFVQDILTATGGNLELNPILNGVLAGFSRKKKYGRFKCGQLNLDFDRLRYASTITPKDSDLFATEVTKRKESDPKSLCRHFQKQSACGFGKSCKFSHRCAICNAASHGAFSCWKRDQNNSSRQNEEPAPAVRGLRRGRPPNPRFRRDRADG